MISDSAIRGLIRDEKVIKENAVNGKVPSAAAG